MILALEKDVLNVVFSEINSTITHRVERIMFFKSIFLKRELFGAFIIIKSVIIKYISPPPLGLIHHLKECAPFTSFNHSCACQLVKKIISLQQVCYSMAIIKTVLLKEELFICI